MDNLTPNTLRYAWETDEELCIAALNDYADAWEAERAALLEALTEIRNWDHPSPKADGAMCKRSEYAVGLANVRRFAGETLAKASR